ncbi:MAG: hypothetical protein H7263_09855 [Candidatus Sericytochromatia bacterium]|nr:hypothetical protein [Candidatus Sericytochromatia bacterium]
MSGIPLNNNQTILNSWNTNKTDKGLTLNEIKNAADTNKDGKLTTDELKSKGLSDSQSSKIINTINTIDIKDKFFSKIGIKTDSGQRVIVKLFEMDEKALPGGSEAISVTDIQQGHRPTCYLLGATSALTHQRPQDIMKLIEKNNDGTYTVTFPGLPETKKVNVPIVTPLGIIPFAQPKIEIKNANKITVQPPTAEELKNYTHKGLNNSTWVAIVDKAYNQYCQNYGVKANYIPSYPQEKASDYGMPWEGVQALTGNKTEHYMVDLTRDSKMLNNIKEALDDKRIVVACTIGKGDTKPEKGELRMSNAHVFGIMGVDTKNKTITVRDPYGQVQYMGDNKKLIDDRSKDGFLVLGMDKFNKYFTDLVIETKNKL